MSVPHVTVCMISDPFKTALPHKALSVYSDQTEETEMDFPCQTGVSSFLATFGADIQKQFKVYTTASDIYLERNQQVFVSPAVSRGDTKGSLLRLLRRLSVCLSRFSATLCNNSCSTYTINIVGVIPLCQFSENAQAGDMCSTEHPILVRLLLHNQKFHLLK